MRPWLLKLVGFCRGCGRKLDDASVVFTYHSKTRPDLPRLCPDPSHSGRGTVTSPVLAENNPDPPGAQIRFWQEEARLARPAEANRQPLSLSGLLTDPPMLPTPAGVLTRHTGTLLTINDLRSNNPAHVPAQTGTNPTHGPWGATRTAWLGAQNQLGRVGALGDPTPQGHHK